MLLRPEGKLHRPHSFIDQLSIIKSSSAILPSFKKSCETFNLTVSILDLLIDKSPHLVEQLLTIKKALTKWYDHIRQENLNKTRQIFNMKEKLIVGVRKEIGIVLEEIGYYLRSITEEYNDHNMQQYYVKYLNALKKLEWGHDSHPIQKSHNKQIQTDPEWSSAPVISTQRSIERGSMSTIESPLKRHKEVDINKYIQTKEHNLQLERQLDKLGSMLAQAQEQNKRFKMEITHLLKQNGELLEDSKRYLHDIQQLNKMLQKLKEEEDEKSRKEEQIKAAITQTEKKFRRLDSLQEDLHRELENAEEEIHKKEAELRKQEDMANYFNQHYRVEKDPFAKTRRKVQEEKEGEISQPFQEYRMLFLQALAIEDFLGQNTLNQPYE